MRTCMLIMSIVLASAVLQAQPLVVYTPTGSHATLLRVQGQESSPTHVRVYTPDRYCPYCVFRVNEAERQAREREITDAAWDALRQFDRLRERSRRN